MEACGIHTIHYSKKVVSSQTIRGKQNNNYFKGISNENRKFKTNRGL